MLRIVVDTNLWLRALMGGPPVLATAIDGRANAIVTGDSDLRADDELRAAMAGFGVQLWGVQALINALA